MKFLNQKLGKRSSRKSDLLKARLAIPKLKVKQSRVPLFKPHPPKKG